MSYNEVDAVKLVRPIGVKDADNKILKVFRVLIWQQLL